MITGASRTLTDGRFNILEWQEHIAQSIADILSTPIGTRVMRPDYGSKLPRLVDRPINQAWKLEVYVAVVEALGRWEPRINLQQVQLNETELKDNAVGVELSYTISGTNSSAPHVARIPVQLDNGTIRFNNPAGYTLHGRRVF